jgi:diguanylate cyclase (GGDEF)-like protein/PAS domain S-box-containing protein
MSAYQSKIHYQEQARIITRNISSALEQTIISNFDKTDLALISIIDDIIKIQSTPEIDAHAVNDLIKQMNLRMPFIDTIRFVDNRGNVLFGKSATRTNISSRAYYIQLRDNPKSRMVISKPVKGLTTGKWTIHLARRINLPDGSFGGIVSAGIYLDSFYKLFSTINLGAHGIISMRDETLGIVTHYPTLPGGVSDVGKKTVSDELKFLINRGQTGASYTAVSGTDHVERTYYYKKLSEYPFHLIVGLSTNEYLSSWMHDQIKNGIIVAVFFLFTLYAARLIHRDWITGKQNMAELEDSNKLLFNQKLELELAAQVFEQSRQCMVITDPEGVILRINKYFTEVTGYTPEEAIGKTPRVLKSNKHDTAFYESLWKRLIEDGEWMGEIWNRKKNGDGFACLLNISSVRDTSGKILNYIGINEDITEQKLSSERIYHLAHYDILTGLPNRRLFNDRFSHALQQAERHKKLLAILLLDLDNFKKVNDTLGHQAGDMLLQMVSERIINCLRKLDTVARLGGDEFVILLEDINEAIDVKRISQKIIDAVSEPIMLEGSRTHIGVSIGACVFPEDGLDIMTLFKNADTAMYRAKGAGKNRCQFFDADMAQQAIKRLSIESDLRDAIPDELFLLYQPQASILSNRIIGVEALVRWHHPQRGIISPNEFIPIAEEIGKINQLGEWVLWTACRQAARWYHENGLSLRIAVNISAQQLVQSNFVDTVENIIRDCRIPPSMLELELTESMLMSNLEESIALFHRLKKIGLSIAMDDFGTGYSSLSYLKKLPIDRLKIDRSFISDIPGDKDDVAIIRTIIAMARRLNLSVIAEGVEHAYQADFLADEGCEEFQGFALARPISAEEVTSFIEKVHMAGVQNSLTSGVHAEKYLPIT